MYQLALIGSITILVMFFSVRGVINWGKYVRATVTKPASEAVDRFLDERARVYNALPPETRKYVDARRAKNENVLLIGAAGAWIVFVTAVFPPIAFPAGVVAMYWVHRNWKVNSNDTESSSKGSS